MKEKCFIKDILTSVLQTYNESISRLSVKLSFPNRALIKKSQGKKSVVNIDIGKTSEFQLRQNVGYLNLKTTN